MSAHYTDKDLQVCIRQLGKIMQDGLLFVDSQGVIIKANAAVCSLLGYGMEELAGKNFFEVSMIDLDRLDASLREKRADFKMHYFQRSEQYQIPMQLIARDGTPVQVSLRSVIARNKSGELAVAAAVIRPAAGPLPKDEPSDLADPHERWDLEQNYRSILEHSGDGILITDFNSHVLTVNMALVNMLGYADTQEIAGRYLLELAPFEGTYTSATGDPVVLTKQYYDSQIQTTSLLFETGHARNLLYMIHKSGHVVTVEATMSLLTCPQGNRRGTIAICRDITERLLAEKKTLEAKLFMENVFETARDGIYVTDSLGRTIMVNQAFSDITGYTQSELIGIEPASLLPDEADIAVTRQAIDAMSNRDDMSLFETKWQRRDGTIFPVEVCLAVLKTAAGEDNGIVATVRDITERVMAQQALQRSCEDLDQKVRERTESLEDMNTALRVLLKGREEDKQSLEEKTLANINELVLPYLSRLKGTRLDERQRASISIIEANLKDIIAPFGAKTSARNLSLTPSEIQIANLIKHGMTAKEIAGITSLSPRTIECHRASIRKKLGIKNRKVNLRVFLLSSY